MRNKLAQIDEKKDQLRADDILGRQQEVINRRIDKLFALLFIFQWLVAVGTTYFNFSSPFSYERFYRTLVGGGIFTAFFVFYAAKFAGGRFTRIVVAAGQILVSGFPVYLTVGIESNNHVFISLVLLAFYRDWRIFIPSFFFAFADYFLRGLFDPLLFSEAVGGLELNGARYFSEIILESLLLVLFCRYIQSGMRANAEQTAALESNEERYRAVVEQSEDGIAIIEPETFRVVECNESFARLLGYGSVRDMEPLTAYDFNADEDWRDKYLIKQKGSQKIYYSGEKNYRRRTGEFVRVEVNASLISFNDNQVFCINVKDITERKRAEEELSDWQS